MAKTQLFYKGKHQPHGLVDVNVKDVEKLLETEDFCLPGQENVNEDTSVRSTRSDRGSKSSLKRKER